MDAIVVVTMAIAEDGGGRAGDGVEVGGEFLEVLFYAEDAFEDKVGLASSTRDVSVQFL